MSFHQNEITHNSDRCDDDFEVISMIGLIISWISNGFHEESILNATVETVELYSIVKVVFKHQLETSV